MTTANKQKTISASLITIPISDIPSLLPPSSSSPNNESHQHQHPQQRKRKRTNEEPNNSTNDNDRLLLLQLPKSITIQDVLPSKSNKNQQKKDPKEPSSCIIVTKPLTTSGGGEPNKGGTNDTESCHFIINQTGTSYKLIRAETSNSYILLPSPMQIPQTPSNPPLSSSSSNTATTTKNFTTPGGVPVSLTHAPGRLMNGGTDTFFLECVSYGSYNERRVVVEELLGRCVYPPSPPPSSSSLPNETQDEEEEEERERQRKGYSISELAYRIGCSQSEIREVLNASDSRAFPLPPSTKDDMQNNNGMVKRRPRQGYGILSEETELETMEVVIDVLMEWEGALDYYEKGVVWHEMMEEVCQRVKQGGGYSVGGVEEGAEEYVVRYCLNRCRVDGVGLYERDEGRKTKGCVRIDVDKIAIYIAHSLFRTRSSTTNGPWTYNHFLTEWNRRLPGIGSVYEPKPSLLRGVALRSLNPRWRRKNDDETDGVGGGGDNHQEDDSRDILEYFPKQGLPSDPEKRFGALFRRKERWREEEIVPYLSIPDIGNSGSRNGNGSVKELLLRYAVVVPGELEDGRSDVWYGPKRRGGGNGVVDME